ncbi:DUF2779 domain-containing protein [Mesobacillus subterraneus]|uniref:DUF2779 domain-containing protein n=1 Tax=Mesobacillus subterraneus TaxID=285983 RepID=A0A427TTM4_9BACI|nr:DUF2779 domain-containing protein [Mesobacillus subterraneus]RSD27628.1 DUF2779 domain-containing protein [Mesobacillus subterraneus]
MFISKSDYLLYKQCPKAIWYKFKTPKVFDKNANQMRLDKGNQVTEHARNLFPNGSLVPYSSNRDKMASTTKDLIMKGERTIYEAAFGIDGLFVICDILHLDKDGWKIYEVKSSTSIKERNLDDLAFQYHVVQHFLPIHSTLIIHINNKYVRNGELEVTKLFSITDLTDELKERIFRIQADVSNIHSIGYNFSTEPKQDIGIHCNKYGKEDFPCAAKEHCWSHIPEHSVFDITRIGKKAFDLYYDGITSISDVPNDFKLSEAQKVQVFAYKENRSLIDLNNIKEYLDCFRYPLYFLDFETYQQTIPLFNGISPYQQIPFQYSLHIQESSNGDLEHKEFLAKEGTDPRRVLAERLTKDIPKGSCSVAFNMAFEKMVLKGLAHNFPDLEDHLMDIHDNMVDLMVPFQKKWYYKNEMKGSYSIKYVLPALLPNDESLNYQTLTIQNGSMAMEIYEQLHTYPKEKIETIREHLLAYCKLDTYAMVKVFDHLNSSVQKKSS